MGLAATKQEAFWEACGFGNKDRVKRFILEGINVNWRSYTHNSCPIHVASQGKKEIVRMLLDAKCVVDARDDRENTALHHAAMKGHADIIQMLLDAGADINAEDKSGWTPLIAAAYYCQLDAVQVLLENKAAIHHTNKDRRSALHETCRSQSTDEDNLYEISKLLIDAGSDINSKSSDVGEADFTPLMFCGYHGHPRVAEALIKAGCDINCQGSNGWTAMHWAADRNQLKVIDVLLKAGLNPLIEGRRGELAVERARDNQVRELLASAVDGANRKEEQMYSTNPSARPMTDRTRLRYLNNNIMATAEGHRVLVEQIERRDRIMSSSMCRTPTSPDGSTSTRPFEDGDSRSESTGSLATRSRSEAGQADEDDDDEEEDKDVGDDPEARGKKTAQVMVNGFSNGDSEALSNGITGPGRLSTVIE